MNHIFAKSKDIQVTYISFIQISKWMEDVLKRKFGYEYQVWCSPILHKNVIGLNFDETTMTGESFEPLVEYFGVNSFGECEWLFDKIFELSSSRIKRKKKYEYKHFVDDLKGFYLIRKRIR